MNYEEREDAKRSAWAVLGDQKADLHTKAMYALRLIEAHYWRAKEDVDRSKAEFRRRVHGMRYSHFYELDIDVYTRHWLWANADRLLPPGVADEIARCWGYEPEQHKMLRKGMSMYGEQPNVALSGGPLGGDEASYL